MFIVLLGRDADTAERVAKYDRYEAGYVRRIKAKYFSNKTPNGGESLIFIYNFTAINEGVL